ncbi:hypothetical protein GCM10022384_02050 [Streptomyces marokkonensis]|uniref:Condensation domain-containing protein n=2 Tax=Streptomyces marokkonensis TaxID=324855 RepID=A0ABP7NRL4_9ACTN
MEGDTFPLTSGQASAWMAFARTPASRLAKPRWWSVPVDVPATLVSTAVQVVMERHEALRSRVVAGTGPGLSQQVDPLTSPVLRIREDLEIDLDDHVALGLVLDGLKREPFDLCDEWPVRWFLGRQPSGNHALIMIVHHFAAGFAGCAVLLNEVTAVLDNLLDDRPADHGLAPVKGPRQLLAEEDGPDGSRADDRARASMRRLLEDLPSTPFPAARTPEDVITLTPSRPTRRVGATLMSPAALHCATGLAHSWGVPVSAVVLAAASLAVRPLLVDESALMWQMFGDRAGRSARFSAACYEPLTSLFDASALASEDDLRAAASETYRRLIRTLRTRPFGEGAFREEVHSISEERGVRIETPFWFNFLTRGEGPELSLDEVSDRWDELSRTDRTVSYEGDEFPGGDFALYAWRDAGHLEVGLYAHERYAGTDTLLAVLRRFGDILYRHAVPQRTPNNADDALLRPRTPHRVRLQGNRWADTAVVRNVLNSLPGVEVTDLRLDGTDAPTLHVTLRAPAGRSVEALRTSALTKLDVPGFVIPDVVTIAGRTVPSGGRSAPAPRSASLDDLLDNVCRMCSLTEVDPLRSYFSAGGTVRGLGSVLQALTAQGWTGLTWRDLCSHRSLTSLAAELRRV